MKNKVISYLYGNDKNSISLVCFGIILLQLITQNLIFKISSIIYLMNIENKINIIKLKKCCLFHTILDIESTFFNNKLLSKTSGPFTFKSYFLAYSGKLSLSIFIFQMLFTLAG